MISKNFNGLAHSIPLNSFNVLIMASSSILVTLYFLLPLGEFPTGERNRPVFLNNYHSQLFARSICENLKDF